MPGSNPNEIVYQNNLAQRAHLSNQQMLLLNTNFNPNTPSLNNFNRPNSILPPPTQSIGHMTTNNQRFTNPSNYQYSINGSTSHFEMNQMYSHVSNNIMCIFNIDNNLFIIYFFDFQ